MLMVEPNAKMDDMYVLRLLDNTYLLVSNAQVLVIRKSLGYKLCISFWVLAAFHGRTNAKAIFFN
jgi:hypothetical protein